MKKQIGHRPHKDGSPEKTAEYRNDMKKRKSIGYTFVNRLYGYVYFSEKQPWGEGKTGKKDDEDR
jgi:hypothetical protein